MANDGQSPTRAPGSPLRGGFKSSTMMVMMTAMTPSENASTRALENEPSELDIASLAPLNATFLSEALGKRERDRAKDRGAIEDVDPTEPGGESTVVKSLGARCGLPRRDFAPLNVNPAVMSPTVGHVSLACALV